MVIAGTVDTKVKGHDLYIQSCHREYERQAKDPCSSVNVEYLATRPLRDLVNTLYPRVKKRKPRDAWVVQLAKRSDS